MAVDDNATYGLKGSQIKKIVNEIDSKQDTLTAGTNVDISNNVISATDTTYSAGTGLDLTGTAFSVDSTIATKSEIPTKTSDITNDGSDGTSTYVEADELATVATSGSYNDLLNKPTIPAAQVNSDWNATSGVAEILNKPTIPVVNNATLTIQKNSTSVGTFTANASSNKTINITVPTTAADVSALPDSTKYGAYFVASINTTTYVMTMTLKDQDGNTLGTAQTIDLPLESVVVNGSYDSSTKEVVLTLQGGSTIRFSVADLVSGLQTEITSSNKLSADLVDDSTTTNKFVTASDKTTWNAKQNALTAGSNIQINGSTISATDTTYSNYTGATSQTAGTAGLVPAPAAGDETKFLSGNGQWTTVSQYSLPIATANDLGGIKVGANLSIDPSTGVLSADAQQVTLYSSTGQNTDGAMTQKATTDALGLKADASSLATVATSGSYDDLTNKPSIPAAQVQSNWTQSDNTKVDYIKNKPSLATVATSGSYNDLSNKPTIPTVNNATLTIQKNGTTVKTFTANASSNVTANITVPTKTSDLTNDGADNTSTYVEADELAAVATSGSYNDLSNKPTIPAAQIQSDWTQTTTTAKDYIKNKPANLVQDANYVHTDNNFTTTLKNKLNGIESGAEVNQNAFSNVSVNGVTVAADAKTDTLTLTAGNNVTLTGDASNDTVTISSTDTNTTYSFANGTNGFTVTPSGGSAQTITVTPSIADATTSTSGLMSATDKAEFDLSNRVQRRLIGDGTTIPDNSDLNTIPFLSVGRYVILGSVHASTLINTPTAKSFTMEVANYADSVLDNEATGRYIYRVRRITTYDGDEYKQYVHSSGGTAGVFTYGSWLKIATTSNIPTVNNATLTIQKNGTTVQTFTANSSENKTVNITVPTNNNQLTNGAGYQTAANVQSAISGKADSATTLAGYGITDAYTKSQVDTALSAKQGTLTAGENITIDANNVISATATGNSTITMTDTDPGEGQPLADDNYIAVYGGSGQGGFSRYTANQSISAATTTTLLPDTTQTPDDGVSYANGVAVIQKAGWWILTATVGGAQSAAGYLTVEIAVNNVIVSSASGATTANYTHCRNVIWAGKLSVGDTVKVQVTTQSAMSINKRERGVFCGVLVSED